MHQITVWVTSQKSYVIRDAPGDFRGEPGEGETDPTRRPGDVTKTRWVGKVNGRVGDLGGGRSRRE